MGYGMTTPVKDYIIHTNRCELALSKDINDSLKKGYDLYGSPFSVGINFCQAMIYIEKSWESWIKGAV
jgi:hypothetical protein